MSKFILIEIEGASHPDCVGNEEAAKILGTIMTGLRLNAKVSLLSEDELHRAVVNMVDVEPQARHPVLTYPGNDDDPYLVELGATFDDAALALIAKAGRKDHLVSMIFEGFIISADPESTLENLQKIYRDRVL